MNTNNRIQGSAIIQEFITCDPSWFNEQGLLVNLEGPDFTAGFTRHDPKASRFVGFYVADPNEDRLHGTWAGKHVGGQDLLKITISRNRIHQELVDDQMAIIHNDGLIRIMDKSGRQIESWMPFHELDSTQPYGRTTFKKVWRRTTATIVRREAGNIDSMPVTYGEFFVALTREMESTLRALGFADEMDVEYENSHEDPWGWVYKLAQESTDESFNTSLALKHHQGKQWTTMPTGNAEFRLWRDALTAFHSYTPLRWFQPQTLTAKAVPASVAPIIQKMRQVITMALTLRDVTWKEVLESLDA